MTAMDQGVLQQLQQYVNDQIENKVSPMRANIQALMNSDMQNQQTVPQIKQEVGVIGMKLTDLGTNFGDEVDRAQETS